jgi:hypothetical protein
MGRKHAVVVSVLLAGAAVAGAYAAASTFGAGPEQPAQPVSASLVADRSAELDWMEASIRKTKDSKPPMLPAVPTFPDVPAPAVSAGRLAAPVAAAPVTSQVVVRAEHELEDEEDFEDEHEVEDDHGDQREDEDEDEREDDD